MPSAIPLTLEDLQAKAPQAPQVVQKIRDSHHQLARLVAEGQKVVEISLITGYSPEHIHRLEGDPAFQELVVHYKSVIEVKYINVHERISGLASDTIQEIHARLREAPGDFTVASLTELAKVTLDRSGFGPQKTINQNTISAQVTPDDLARIRAQRTQGEVRQIGQKDNRGSSLPALDQTPSAPDPGPDILPPLDLAPGGNSEVPAPGLAGRGDQVREEVREEDEGGTGAVVGFPRPVDRVQ